MIGAPEQAIKDLKEAKKNGDTSPSVVRKLATLLSLAGRDSEAIMLSARFHVGIAEIADHSVFTKFVRDDAAVTLLLDDVVRAHIARKLVRPTSAPQMNDC